MSDVTLDPRAMFEQIVGAFDHASDVALAAVRATEVRKSGRLADSYQLGAPHEEGMVWWTDVVSALPYAGPVEHGAWMRTGRGPHMRGNRLLRLSVGKVYAAAMKDALPAGYKPRRSTVRTVVVKL